MSIHFCVGRRNGQKNHRQKQKQAEKVSLQDTLNEDLLKMLKQTKQQLIDDEEQKKREEAERKRKEQKQLEKNKSFAELLEENPMDWKKYK
ncbi:hypothetical protein NG54_05915 [Heyndrickxia ginsengihumi]|uniref:DUF3886 domain-containing protein n=2 Tax=Heyndrickxia ginsengihumi TaxID=363870 RepID=A0A0A6VEM1_9BACI|nr:hypothetical protein NG54_05915 [Heyndrickxia ginsengihumi]